MPVQTIKFNKGDAPISVEVTCGHAHTGSYTFRLWEPSGNQKVMEEDGNFINADDDVYQLPLPNSANNGRFVQCLGSIVIIPPIKKYNVFLTFTQNGTNLGTENFDGETDNRSIVFNMVVKLVQEGS